MCRLRPKEILVGLRTQVIRGGNILTTTIKSIKIYQIYPSINSPVLRTNSLRADLVHLVVSQSDNSPPKIKINNSANMKLYKSNLRC